MARYQESGYKGFAVVDVRRKQTTTTWCELSRQLYAHCKAMPEPALWVQPTCRAKHGMTVLLCRRQACLETLSACCAAHMQPCLNPEPYMQVLRPRHPPPRPVQHHGPALNTLPELIMTASAPCPHLA